LSSRSARWTFDQNAQKKKKEPGVVAHYCNPSYSGGGDWEDSLFKVRPGKKSAKPPSQPVTLGMVVHAYHPSYPGSVNKRITIQAGQGIKERLHSKNDQSKKG
jgi:hypothetical protein